MKKKVIIIVIAVVVVIAAILAIVFLTKSDQPYGDYDLKDYITVAKYKGLEVEKKEVTVTNKDIQSEINTRLKEKSTSKEVKTGVVKKGDVINIDYVGKINGKKFDGGTASDASVTAGSSGFIDGFDDALIGMKVGEKKTAKLTFPSDYQNSTVAGKQAEFTITVNSKTETTVPKLTEAFVKANSDYKTIDEYKASVKKDVEKTKEEELANEQKNTLWSEVVSKSKVKKYPEKELADAKTAAKKTYEDYASSNNMTLDALIKQMGMSKSDLTKTVKEEAENNVKQEMITYYIADKENLKVDDVKQMFKDRMKKQGYTENTFKSQAGVEMDKYIEENYNNIWLGFTVEKVTDLIYKDAKFVEKKATTNSNAK